MITSRDLDAIGPPPPRHPVRAGPPRPDASLGSGAVSVAAVVTLRGPCPRPDLDDLTGRVTALLAAGIKELVIDLSAVTHAETRVLRAVDRIRQVIEDRGGSLSVLGESPGGRARPTGDRARHPVNTSDTSGAGAVSSREAWRP